MFCICTLLIWQSIFLYKVDVQHFFLKKHKMILIASWYLITLFIWILVISFGVYVYIIVCLDRKDAFSLGTVKPYRLLHEKKKFLEHIRVLGIRTHVCSLKSMFIGGETEMYYWAMFSESVWTFLGIICWIIPIWHNIYPINNKLTREIVIQHKKQLIAYCINVIKDLENIWWFRHFNFFLCGRTSK